MGRLFMLKLRSCGRTVLVFALHAELHSQDYDDFRRDLSL